MTRKRGALRQEILNAPNLVTLARIALIPFFVVLLAAESRRNSFWASLVFGLASGTDFLDGYLARRFNLITTFGKFIDPLADKLIVMSAYIELVHLARLPAWVVIVILAREFIISGLRTIAMSEGIVIAASQGGKWKTALQLVGIVTLVVNYSYPIDFLVVRFTVNFHMVGLVLTYAALFFSIYSAVQYLWDFLGGVFEAREERTSTDPELPAIQPSEKRPPMPSAGVSAERG